MRAVNALSKVPQNGLTEFDDVVNGEIYEPGSAAGLNLLAVLWRRRWTVLSITFLCLIIGAIYLLKATPIYTSSSRLLVEQGGSRILSDQGSAIPKSDSYLYTQAQLLASTPILSSAIDVLHPEKMKSFEGIDNHLIFLRKQVDVSVGKKDDLITVSFDSASPTEAATVVNAIVESYVDFNMKRKQTSAAEMLQVLQRDKDKRDAERTTKVKEMLEFKVANGALSFESDKGNIIVQRLEKLSDALSVAELDEMAASQAFATAEKIAGSPSALNDLMTAQRKSKGVYVSEQDIDEQLRKDISKIEMQAAVQGSSQGPNGPTGQMAQVALQNLRRQLAEKEKNFADAYVAALKQSLETAHAKVVELRSAVESQKKQALDLNSKSVHYAILNAELQRVERQCDTLDARIKEINVNEDSGVTNINILEAARPEDQPTKPRRSLSMAVALMLGLMLGMGAALVRETMDQRIRSAEEVSAVLNVPVLGVVPHMPEKLGVVARGQKAQLEPMSNVAEAFRTVRTALYFGVPSGDCKTVLVTSPTPGDGKSTTASNLAIVMASAGQRVLLVDADFRKPMQHKIFDLKMEIGLSSVVVGKSPASDALCQTGVDTLKVIPCGPLPPNPSELLNSPAFADFITEMSAQFDYIVIDSPPVLAVTDARILGAVCDVTVLVLRAEKSTRRLGNQAREALASVGARLLGAVVNDVAIDKAGYGAGYGYYGYGYGHASGANGSHKTKTRLLEDSSVRVSLVDPQGPNREV